MAKIVLSKEAPDQEVTFSLTGIEAFTAPLDTDNRTVVAEAEAHPWLSVEYDRSEVAVATYRPDSLAPKDDILSAENSEAFDPEALKRDALDIEGVAPLAVEAGLNQSKPVTEGGVSRTLAADAKNTNAKDKD